MESFVDASSPFFFFCFHSHSSRQRSKRIIFALCFLPVFVCCSCVICNWLRALLALSLARPGKVDDDDDNVGLHTTFTYPLYEH